MTTPDASSKRYRRSRVLLLFAAVGVGGVIVGFVVDALFRVVAGVSQLSPVQDASLRLGSTFIGALVVLLAIVALMRTRRDG